MLLIVGPVLGGLLLITLILLITGAVKSVSHLPIHHYSVKTGHYTSLILSDGRSTTRPAALQTLERPSATRPPRPQWSMAVKVCRPWLGCRESQERQLTTAHTAVPTWRWPQATIGQTSLPMGGTRWACLSSKPSSTVRIFEFSQKKTFFSF